MRVSCVLAVHDECVRRRNPNPRKCSAYRWAGSTVCRLSSVGIGKPGHVVCAIAHPRVIREAEKGRCPADGATVNAFARSLRLGIIDLVSHRYLSLDEFPSRMRPGSSAADGGRWTKSGGRAHIHRVALPRVQPIIPTWRMEPFDDPEWLFEFKYDGFRGLFYLEQGRCRFITRNGNVMSRFEVLADQVAAVLDFDEAVIDGEVIAADETGRPQFYELLRVPRSASYVSSGSTAPTCALCRSPSVDRAFSALFRRGRRSFPRRSPSRAGGANTSS